ncbi:MAG: hypothetical protein J0H19_20015 [Rhodospirillales bacterium]|nr:hypothetical protein [Rhodospirillales bacterium]
MRVLMLGLTFAIVLPLMSFSAYLVMEAAQRAQSLMESELRERARLTAASIDQMLVVVRSRLFAMAASPSLASGDFDAFHDRIADLVRPRSLIVVLTDAAGHTMLSTAVPFGTPLPDFPLQAGFRRVIDSGVPTISGFVPDPITHRPALYMSVLVPTTEHGPCVLSIDVSGVLQDLLEQDRLQDGWAAAVVDREGYVIAHSQDAKRFVGRLGQLDAVARVQSANEGGFTYRSVDGELRDVAFTHVALSGWAVVMGIPDATLMAPVRISTLQLACGGMATLAVALILAGVVGRQAARCPARCANSPNGGSGSGAASASRSPVPACGRRTRSRRSCTPPRNVWCSTPGSGRCCWSGRCRRSRTSAGASRGSCMTG